MFAPYCRLVLALLHPELASCPRLTVESDLVVLYPDTPCSSLRERLEGVVRGEWGEHKQEVVMSYSPPVECEVNEVENDSEVGVEQEVALTYNPLEHEVDEVEFVDCDSNISQLDYMEPEWQANYVPRVQEKPQIYTHAQKLEFVRFCNANGGNVLGTARKLRLNHTCLRRWKEQEQELEAQVFAGEGSRSKAVNLAPKPLRPFEKELLNWLKEKVQTSEKMPTRKEVSIQALYLHKVFETNVGAQRRFKSGANFVEQFLDKTKTKELVAVPTDSTEELDAYECNQCGQTFNSMDSLKKHKLYNHSDEKPFVCPHCSSSFKGSENLKIHIRTHTGEKPYNCDLCGYASADPSNFRKHQKNHLKKSLKAQNSQHVQILNAYSLNGV